MTTNSGHSDVMTRCAIESLDMANDFALQEDWSNASKFLDVTVGFLWRASWEQDIEIKKTWNRHIIDLELDMVGLMISLRYPYVYENETYLDSFGINETWYTISVKNVTWAINKTIGELLPYSDIDPACHPEYEGHSSNLQIWEKYKEYYKDKPTSGKGFRVGA